MSARTGTGKRADAGGVEKKAWASGRVLTADQRQRKQEVDRKANRFLKKEVQDRLALLEARVLELEASRSNNAGNDLAPDIRQRVDVASSTSPASTDIDGTINSSLNNLPDSQFWPEAIDYGHDSARGPATTSVHELDMTNVVSNQGAFANPQLNAMLATTGRAATPGGRDLTMFLNHLVDHIRNIPPERICYDDEHNQDVIINAVLKGWKFAMSRYEQVCPLWEVLQMVDMCLFKDCNMVERISCLRMLHKRYMFETKTVATQVEGPLPAWFQPHMAESLIAHEPVIDHLTWPKLRERLMSSRTDTLTNKFWALFARNIRMIGNFEPFEIVAFSPKSSLYQLTHKFESGLLDMANWRMDVNFFYEFPGLADDVPPANYMPLTQLTPRFGLAERVMWQQQHHQQQHQQLPQAQTHPQHQQRYEQYYPQQQQALHQQQRRATVIGEMPARGTHVPADETIYETSGAVPWNGFFQ